MVLMSRGKFESLVERREGGCWLWTGKTTPDGYGFRRNGDDREYADEAAYRLFIGDLPDGMDLTRRCRVPRCANPEHMEVVGPEVKQREKLLERFWQKVSPEPNTGCWLWDGAEAVRGYGSLGIWEGGKMVCRLSHRISYELFVGPIPNGLTIDHRCRVRACVNPDHLEPVTNEENIRRGVEWRRLNIPRRTHCNRGHEFVSGSFFLRPDGNRECKACKQISKNARRATRKSNIGEERCP